MTTIAYRDGVLAADTQITSGNNARCGAVQKIGKAPDGSLWAFSGNTQHQEAFVAWAIGDRSGMPKEWDSAVGILISPAGVVREWWGEGWLEIDAPFYAWGSGERVARGALAAGVTAERALQIAIELDLETGGQITVLKR